MPRAARSLVWVAAVLSPLVLLPWRETHAANEVVSVWMTTSDRSRLLAPQASVTFAADSGSNPTTIDVNEATTFQTMDGFGASLTDSSAWLIWNRMSASQRSALLNAVFSRTSGIGLSVLRQPMGGSDFSKSHIQNGKRSLRILMTGSPG
jgi:glucosylceramidase